MTAPSSFPALRVAVLLFLFFNCVYLLTSTGRVRSMDEIDSVLQAESLLLRHNTAIPQVLNSSILGFGKKDRNGIQRSAWPAGHAVLVLPWYALGHYVFVRLPGITADNADLAVAAAACWSSATYSAIAVACFFLLALKLGLDARNALLCAMLLGLSTPLFVYSGWLYTEPASIALFFVAALLLFGSGRPAPMSHAIIGALILAFAIHIRPNNMVTVFVFIAAAMVAEHSMPEPGFRYRTTILLIAIIGLSGALYLARNYELFGNPFDFGVPAAISENGKNINSWRLSFWTGLHGMLFTQGKSAFLFCPPILLGMLGVPRLWRRNRALAVLCGAGPLANLVFYAFRTQWEGGYNWGPRYLLISLTLLTIPVAALFLEPPRWLRPALWATAVVGFLVQVLGLSVNMMEDMIVNHYYDQNFDYRMGYSAIGGQLRLIWKYLHQQPQALGLGWDRWFVFLRSGGASPGPLYVIESLFLAGAIVFGYVMWKTVRDRETLAL